MRNVMIAAVAVLLMSGAAFAQDEMKKDAKTDQKQMKHDAKAMKHEAKKTGDDSKADAAKQMKHDAKMAKKKTS